jgi:hypothetical protein
MLQSIKSADEKSNRQPTVAKRFDTLSFTKINWMMLPITCPLHFTHICQLSPSLDKPGRFNAKADNPVLDFVFTNIFHHFLRY